MKKTENYLPGVRGQYEEYPYPPRAPEDEKKRLLIPIASRMDLVSHNCFNGNQDFNNFHVLVAGGGTGDSAVFWAEQLREKKNARIVYLDMSKASMEIAQQRAEVRKLDNIEWRHGSILNIPDMGIGNFDFIECSGVLHHLENPDAGLMALQSILKPEGAMALMVYATYGRTAVYHMQKLMQLVNQDETDRNTEIENTKKVLANLPPENWFSVGQKHVVEFTDIKMDEGIYDLLLHTQDRSYTILESYEWLERCALQMTSVPGVGTSEHMFYHPETFIKDVSLLSSIKQKAPRIQQAIAENLSGRIIKHYFYATHKGNIDTVADPKDLQMVPYTTLLGAAPLIELANTLEENPEIPITVNSDKYQDAVITEFKAQKYTTSILRLIDNQRSIEDIFNAIKSDPKFKDKKPNKDEFLEEFSELTISLNRGNFLFLRYPSVAEYTHLSTFEDRVKSMY